MKIFFKLVGAFGIFILGISLFVILRELFKLWMPGGINTVPIMIVNICIIWGMVILIKKIFSSKTPHYSPEKKLSYKAEPKLLDAVRHKFSEQNFQNPSTLSNKATAQKRQQEIFECMDLIIKDSTIAYKKIFSLFWEYIDYFEMSIDEFSLFISQWHVARFIHKEIFIKRLPLKDSGLSMEQNAEKALKKLKGRRSHSSFYKESLTFLPSEIKNILSEFEYSRDLFRKTDNAQTVKYSFLLDGCFDDHNFDDFPSAQTRFIFAIWDILHDQNIHKEKFDDTDLYFYIGISDKGISCAQAEFVALFYGEYRKFNDKLMEFIGNQDKSENVS